MIRECTVCGKPFDASGRFSRSHTCRDPDCIGERDRRMHNARAKRTYRRAKGAALVAVSIDLIDRLCKLEPEVDTYVVVNRVLKDWIGARS